MNKIDPFDDEETRILILEDDPINLRLFRNILVKTNFFKGKVDCASDSLTALNKLAKNDYSLVLTDMQLYGEDMGGISFMEEAHRRGIQSRFVVITSYSMETDIKGILSHSMVSGIIRKPVCDYHEFLAKIRYFLQDENTLTNDVSNGT